MSWEGGVLVHLEQERTQERGWVQGSAEGRESPGVEEQKLGEILSLVVRDARCGLLTWASRKLNSN